jgi:hypothetical protein
VEKDGTKIVRVRFEKAPPDKWGCPLEKAETGPGVTVEAKMFIGTSYEGDLALVLRVELRRRLGSLQSKESAPEWADIVRDLENLEEAEVEVDGKRFRIRSEERGAAVQAFRACGVALPPLGRLL